LPYGAVARGSYGDFALEPLVVARLIERTDREWFAVRPIAA